MSDLYCQTDNLPKNMPIHRFSAGGGKCDPGVRGGLPWAHRLDSQELSQVVQPAGWRGRVGSGCHHQHVDALLQDPVHQPQSGCKCDLCLWDGEWGFCTWDSIQLYERPVYLTLWILMTITPSCIWTLGKENIVEYPCRALNSSITFVLPQKSEMLH